MRFHPKFATLSLALVCTGFFPSLAQSGTIVRMETSLGNIDIELYDQTAPITVTNFLNYVRDADYNNTFIHRSAILGAGPTPDILQGGGYTSANDDYARVSADDPIINEYSESRPNERGTIAMARTSDPDSATSEWFFNTTDNSAILGASNTGGYAVFGRVVGSNNDGDTTNDGPSMAVVDAIAALERWNGTGIDSRFDAAWTNLPLIGFSTNQTFVPEQHLVMIDTIREPSSTLRTTSHAGNIVYFSAEESFDLELTNLVSSASPSTSDMPAGVNFKEGFFSFELQGVNPGGAASVAIVLPEDFQPNTYYMYGPTPDNRTDHWYEFKFDGRTGAEFFGNYVVLNFIDGERGDADLTANGTIVDPGAPGISTAAAVSSSGGGGGGGCTLSAQTRNTPISLDFGILLLALGMHVALRNRTRNKALISRY